MKEKNLRGLWALIVVFVIFGAVAVGTWWMSSNLSNPQFVVDQGGLYPETFGENVAVDVTDILEVGTIREDNNARMYVVAVGQDEKYLAMIANPEDPAVKEALSKGAEGLAQNPVRFVGDTTKDSDSRDNLSKIRSDVLTTAEAKAKLDTSFVVNVKKRQDTARIMSWVSYGSLALLVLFAGLFAFNVSRRKKAYGELYSRFPELEGNLDLLVSQGQYADQARGLFVYKDVIICLGTQNRLVDAKDLLYVVGVKHTVQQGVATHVNYTIEAYDKSFKKHVLAPISNKKKTLDGDIERFSAFLDAAYPDVLVGADHAPEYQALKNAAGR